MVANASVESGTKTKPMPNPWITPVIMTGPVVHL